MNPPSRICPLCGQCGSCAPALQAIRQSEPAGVRPGRACSPVDCPSLHRSAGKSPSVRWSQEDDVCLADRLFAMLQVMPQLPHAPLLPLLATPDADRSRLEASSPSTTCYVHEPLRGVGDHYSDGALNRSTTGRSGVISHHGRKILRRSACCSHSGRTPIRSSAITPVHRAD